MTPTEIEAAVFVLEEVRIVIRASINAKLGDFKYTRKAADNASVSDWLEQRIKPLIGSSPVVAIDGNGAIPHGRTKMSTLRQSYER
jgi:hypothetical protein